MRIGQKLVVGFIMIASVVAIVGAIAIKYNISIISDVDRVLLCHSNEAKAAEGIVRNIQNIQTSINRLLFATVDKAPEQRKRTKEVIEDSISKMRQFTPLWEDAIKLKVKFSGEGEETREEAETFQSLKKKIDGLILLVNQTVAVQGKSGSEAARTFFQSKVEPALLDSLRIAENLGQIARERTASDTKGIRQAVSYSTGIIVVLTIVSLLIATVVRHFIWWTISKPLAKLRDAADKINKGELETKVEINSQDEIGALAQSLNDMACKLKQVCGGYCEEQPASDAEAQKGLPLEVKLQRHIKQLDCFYGLSKLIEQPGISLEEIFQKTTDLIRNSFQYPENTCIRITFEGVNYKADNFRKSELSQYAKLRVYGEEVGSIEVYYVGEERADGKSPFLKEEHDLLDAVAEHLGRIAARRQTGEKLELLRHLIDRSNDCIFIMEPKWGRLIDANDRACSSLGYSKEELLKMAFKNIEQTIPEDASWNEQMDKLKYTEDLVIEGQHRRKDGTVFFTETSLKLVSQKKESFIIAIARNVTERKQAEQRQAQLIKELEHSNQEVKNINQELKDFAYVVSHDLKAPLRGINAVVKWITADYADKLDENGKKQLDSLTKRALQMHNLIDGILQYSRVGRVQERKVAVNLNTLAVEAIEMVAAPENITITVENELPTIECEQTRIMQVFQNLLSNAVKYMDKPQGLIKVGCVEDGGFWKFNITDNGPGIEEKDFEKIFKIFQTVKPRSEFESTGIGLSVVKKIVELYGGKIWVESNVGQGSTFFFTLPKQEIGAEKNEELQTSIVS
ncbi:MAG: PAS domain S-box protein [Sedimentisphaerales bacterium]|nr:PAS domain S-box protein [Sedimentisphaerales bacterium]